MARKLSSREVSLLLGLGALGAIYLWYSSRTQSASAVAEAAAAKAAAVKVEKPPEVRMDLLAKRAEGYNAEGRDLFKYAVRPPTAEELRLAREEEERRRKAMEEEVKRRTEEFARNQELEKKRQEQVRLNPPPPTPPPIPLKYLGYVGPKADKVIGLEDETGQVIVAKKGDTINGQFRVVDIKLESVVMGYTRPEFKDVTRELTLAAPPSK